MAKFAIIISLLTIALQSQVFPGEGWTITLLNNCTYTVWPVVTSPTTQSIGFSLVGGASKVVNLGSIQRGRLWGRTVCDNSTGKFACKTGDCGSGTIDCSGSNSLKSEATTLFEFGGTSGEDSYDISLLDGYNLPMLVVPHSPGCSATGCIFNVDQLCPSVLKQNGTCQSACQVFGTGQYCCRGAYAGPSKCKPTGYSGIFKKACPRAYSYPYDDANTTFACKGNSTYTVTFCPSPSAMTSAFLTVPQSPTPAPSASPFPTTTAAHSPSDKSLGKGRKHSSHTSLLVAIPILAAVMLTLLCYGTWICLQKRKAMEKYNAEIDEIRAAESLQFSFSTIRTSTNNFSPHNKLGEGGFGEVYKGLLESGQEVAIKRLSKTSGQGVVEFRTEVVLVAKLQHKNLVKLIGFCVTSKEKILVYEYLANSSLDKFLFDSAKNAALDWQTRLNIMVGIARGLLYLHEDSRLKVIHRDLKASNILLDDAMNPKISDFGLAKLFGGDQTQGEYTSKIAGTYGYMAPEYALTGHYSVKSDVYSFGVIMLEIVSGQKSRFYGRVQLEEALLHRAWRLWNEEKPLDLVDTTLSNNFPTEEVLKCIHIGLLCIQEDAVERPRMTSIVAALGGQSVNFPTPKPPHFFGRASNIENHHTLDKHTSPYIYTGRKTITDFYSRE